MQILPQMSDCSKLLLRTRLKVLCEIIDLDKFALIVRELVLLVSRIFSILVSPATKSELDNAAKKEVRGIFDHAMLSSME